jgi:hypothetical protein
MCEAPKERSTDFLLLAALAHPDFEDECRRLSHTSTAELFAVVGDDAAPLPKRAIAAWYLAGTGRLRGTRLPTRRGDPQALFATFHEMGVPRHLVAACQAVAARSQYPLPAFLPLVWKAATASEVRKVIHVDLDPSQTIRGIPLWALDKYTRTGKQALRAFLKTNVDVRGYLEAHMPSGNRLEAVGVAVFYVEGGQVNRLLVWEKTEQLMFLGIEGDLARTRLKRHAMSGLLRLVRDNLGHLNQIRADMMETASTHADAQGLTILEDTE